MLKITVVGLAALLSLGACGDRSGSAETKKYYVAPKVVMKNFDAIKNGMTYDRVALIMGSPGVLDVESELAGIRTQSYHWMAEEGVGNMSVMLQNDVVVMKAQFGLQ